MTPQTNELGGPSAKYSARALYAILLLLVLLITVDCLRSNVSSQDSEQGDKAANQVQSAQPALDLQLRRVPEDGEESNYTLLEEYWVVVEDGKDVKQGHYRRWSQHPYMLAEDCWYSHGKLHGPYKKWQAVYKQSPYAKPEDAVLLGIERQEREYVDGIQHGWYRSFGFTGGMNYEERFDLGRQGITKRWDRNGNLSSILLPLDDNRRHRGEGRWVYRSWDEKGQLLSEGFTKDGLDDGLRRDWYRNGQLKKESTSIAGVTTGSRRYWNPDGSLKWVQEYKDGKLIWQQNYKDGKPDGKRFVPDEDK
ncbi:MAG: hypothetical protein KDB82_04960 [Planctomycetes bacterium]|nr:hypothetical protein [Planctomycetota bacterium]